MTEPTTEPTVVPKMGMNLEQSPAAVASAKYQRIQEQLTLVLIKLDAIEEAINTIKEVKKKEIRKVSDKIKTTDNIKV